MTSSQFISVRETSQILGISEKKVMDLIESQKLQAYRIAEKFLRLKREEVLMLRNSGNVTRDSLALSYTPGEKLRDFFYFNDFYILSTFIIAALLYVIFYT